MSDACPPTRANRSQPESSIPTDFSDQSAERRLLSRHSPISRRSNRRRLTLAALRGRKAGNRRTAGISFPESARHRLVRLGIVCQRDAPRAAVGEQLNVGVNKDGRSAMTSPRQGITESPAPHTRPICSSWQHEGSTGTRSRFFDIRRSPRRSATERAAPRPDAAERRTVPASSTRRHGDGRTLQTGAVRTSTRAPGPARTPAAHLCALAAGPDQYRRSLLSYRLPGLRVSERRPRSISRGIERSDDGNRWRTGPAILHRRPAGQRAGSDDYGLIVMNAQQPAEPASAG